ncbi:MAG: Type 1 glutamine amidotransferase-like domain-containing protein [Acholeplasmatales bacterium]|nr:Type 1 glutamine amidotransferase-like domain-containing protein [Acholeplasmatales bacterium]
MARYFLVGGKDDDLKSNYLERVLLLLSGKKEPKLLYFPTAMKDNIRSINHFINTFAGLNVSINVVTLYDKKYTYEELNHLFEISDIIYFGGGNTDRLREKLEEFNIDKLLIKYNNTDKIYAGISAGAIILCNSGMGDSYSYTDNFKTFQFRMVKGFGLLNFSICPHYQKEDLYVFNDAASNLELSYALEDDTAIYINKHVNVFKDNKKHSVYEFKYSLLKPMYPYYNSDVETKLEKI